jgi:hypothetical protein
MFEKNMLKQLNVSRSWVAYKLSWADEKGISSSLGSAYESNNSSM